MFEHGIMPLYTPVGGSWLNMAENIQRVLESAGRWTGSNPSHIGQIIGWFEAVGRALERGPDAVCVGRQACGPVGQRQRGASPPASVGSGAYNSRAHSPGVETRLWLQARQMTH